MSVNMMQKMPLYYRKSDAVKAYFAAVEAALDAVRGDIDAADKNLFIVTAKEFELHERDVGLSGGAAFDDETRRAKVIARLQGNQVFTRAALEELITLYEPLGADVYELFDKYVVLLDFSGHRNGAPKNLAEMMAAIEEVKPAHLQFWLSAAARPADTVIYVGGMVAKRRVQRFGTIPAAKMKTYDDIRKIYGNFDELRKRTYDELLLYD